MTIENTRVEIFDSKGRVRPPDSFTAEEIELLTPERKLRLDALREAKKICDEADVDVEQGKTKLQAAVKKSDDGLAARNKDYPPTTFLEEWRRTVKNR